MPRLEFRAVRRAFGEDPPILALREVDLTVDEGAYMAIQGPSGSGKSTLLNQLALIDRPSAGAYEIDGQEVSGLSERSRARLRSDTFGFIFQSFHLMPRQSALENVELGLLYRGVAAGDRRRLATAALDSVGLSHRRDVAARKLSGGEQQRVAIARATLGGAPVVVADEPTGNLDSDTSSAIVEQLGILNSAGTTVVVVTHDADVAAQARQRVFMRDGRINGDERTTEQSPRTNGGGDAHSLDRVSMPGRASRLQSRDLVAESWRALKGRPGRMGLLVAAVGIAVALVVVTLGLAQTASAQVSTSFDVERNRAVTITVPLLSTQTPARSGIPVDVEARLRQVRGVNRAGVIETHDPVTATTPGRPAKPDQAVVGISPGLLTTAGATVEWAPGHVHVLGRHEVLVGAFIARKLETGPLQLDPTLEIGGASYSIAGIIHGAVRIPELPADLAVNWRYAAELSTLNASRVLVTTSSGAAQQVARQAPLAIDPVRSAEMETEAPPDPTSLRDTIQNDVRSTLLALTIVALLASMLGVGNAMLLGVVERIGELGLRRAIGARPIHILGQTSVEAIIAGLIGGVAGLLVGLAAILGVTLANRWQPVLDLRLVPLALVGGVIVGALGGLPASLRASRIQPADALRR